MASYYVYSGAVGAADGTSWADAYTTLAAAATARAAGDIFFVADDHVETQGTAMTVTFPGTSASPNYCLCVVRVGGTVPPVNADLRDTATISTTGASAINLLGFVEGYGIIFSCAGGGANSATFQVGGAYVQKWKNCVFGYATTANRTLSIGIETGPCVTEFINCKLSFAVVGQLVGIKGNFIWRDTVGAITGAAVPTNLFNGGSTHGSLLIEGVDLSAMVTGKNIVGSTQIPSVYLKDCKLDSAVTIAARQTVASPQATYIIRSDSGATNYRHEKRGGYAGDQTVELTIVRTDGASDGTTPISWKLVTTANARWTSPFEALPISVWNSTTGSAITLTVQGIWGGGTVPNNDDIWMDVEYPGSALTPMGSFISSGKTSVLATATAIPVGSGTWGGSTTKFAMSVSFTPQMKGPITVYIKAAAASATFYIDPKVVFF